MTFCAVPSCGSDSTITRDRTFHCVPSSVFLRTQWVLALGPLPTGSFVCSHHFEASMFTMQGNMKTLKPNAVPKPFLVSLPKDKLSPKSNECSGEAGSSGELVACRVCLAADGRLYAISGSGLEDSLAALTGVALSAEKGFPRHLCAFCCSKLSKCASFRDSCQRSTALLQTLLERGPLTIDVIKTHNQRSRRLTNNLSCTDIFHFGTEPIMEITPLIKTENRGNYQEEEVPIFMEVECLESEDVLKQEASDDNTFELPIQERETPENGGKQVKSSTEIPKWKKDEVVTVNASTLSESDDDYTDGLDKTRAALETSKERDIPENEIKQDKLITENPECKNDGVKTGNAIGTKDGVKTGNPKGKKDRVKTGNPKHKKVGVKTENAKCTKDEVKIANPKLKKVGVETGSPTCKKDGVKTRNRKRKKDELKTDNPKRKKDGAPSTLSESDEDCTDTLEKTEEDLAFEKEFNFEIKVFSKEEQKQQIEERNCTGSTLYTCDVCGQGFDTESTLSKHKTSRHNPSLRYECKVCHHRFRHSYVLRWHRERHRAILKCRECGYISPNRVRAKEHHSMHTGTKLICPHCQKKYDCPSSYYAHVRLRHPAEHEACDECGETFMGKVGLRLHKHKRHGTNDKSNKDKCPDCEVTFQSEAALQKHLELGVGVSHAALWPCAACGESCGSDAARAAHAAEKHPPEQHYCKECNKTFLNLTSFERHMEWKHRAPKAPKFPGRASRPRLSRPRKAQNSFGGPFVCEKCGKLYQNKTLLGYHMNGHLGLKPFKCSHCPKAFASRFCYKNHTRVHTGEKPFQCEQCPKAFGHYCNFVRHVKLIHLRMQEKCDKCGKMLAFSSLAAHVRAVHMNIKYVRRKRDRTKKKRDLVTES